MVETPKDAQPCNAPHPHIEIDAFVNAELGWCACGTPEEVDRLMLQYLQAVEQRHDPAKRPQTFNEIAGRTLSNDTVTLLAYVADSLDWTEHGTSIGGAWLTEAGNEALTNLSLATRQEMT